MVDPVSIVAGRPRGHLSETLWDEPWWQQTEEAAIGGRTNLHLLRWSHSPSGRCFFLYGLILLVSSNGHSMYIYNYIYTVYIQMFLCFLSCFIYLSAKISSLDSHWAMFHHWVSSSLAISIMRLLKTQAPSTGPPETQDGDRYHPTGHSILPRVLR